MTNVMRCKISYHFVFIDMAPTQFMYDRSSTSLTVSCPHRERSNGQFVLNVRALDCFAREADLFFTCIALFFSFERFLLALGVDYTCVLYVHLDVRFTVKCLYDVIFEFSTLKMTLKTHWTRKRTSKLHI
jgi:hypothetical protein